MRKGSLGHGRVLSSSQTHYTIAQYISKEKQWLKNKQKLSSPAQKTGDTLDLKGKVQNKPSKTNTSDKNLAERKYQ
ncbi:MAG: hypothetical protein OIF56_09870 [Cohaesibacter sp.]|nr:hypothetical protein [Cohaesibacter sp.]